EFGVAQMGVFRYFGDGHRISIHSDLFGLFRRMTRRSARGRVTGYLSVGRTAASGDNRFRAGPEYGCTADSVAVAALVTGVGPYGLSADGKPTRHSPATRSGLGSTTAA